MLKGCLLQSLRCRESRQTVDFQSLSLVLLATSRLLMQFPFHFVTLYKYDDVDKNEIQLSLGASFSIVALNVVERVILVVI